MRGDEHHLSTSSSKRCKMWENYREIREGVSMQGHKNIYLALLRPNWLDSGKKEGVKEKQDGNRSVSAA